MSKAKQETTQPTTTTINGNGNGIHGARTRAAARDGVRSANQQLNVLDALCKDHAEEAAEINPDLLLKAIGKVQGVVGLCIRTAAEARRNPKFKSQFVLTE